MDLFSHLPPENSLPYDGEVFYYDNFLLPKDANAYFQQLLTQTDWQQDRVVIGGQMIVTQRKVSWHGDNPVAYHYSGTTKYALPWTQSLLALKSLVETKTGKAFNAALLNYYPDGQSGMGWHSDDEAELLAGSMIASVSLGAERTFAFKHKTRQEKRRLILANGSLLTMAGNTQRCWLHRVPTTTKTLPPRINVTFRQMRNG